MGNKEQKISVVVTSYIPHDEELWKMTQECRRKLVTNTFNDYEFVWIKCGDLPSSKYYMSPTCIVVSTSENLGNPKMWDAGVAVSSGDIIILMDNDVLVEKDWDKEMVEKLVDPTVGITFPMIKAGDEDNYRARRDGCCFAFRRETYERAGKFLEDQPFKLGYYEDDWFQYRVQHQLGLRLISCPNSKVNHKGQATTKKIWSKEIEEGIEANKEWYEDMTDSVYPHLEKHA